MDDALLQVAKSRQAIFDPAGAAVVVNNRNDNNVRATVVWLVVNEPPERKSPLRHSQLVSGQIIRSQRGASDLIGKTRGSRE